MSDLTDDQRAELRRLAEGATPDPWGGVADLMRLWAADLGERVDFHGGDSKYLASLSPSVVLSLLDEVERLRGEQLTAREVDALLTAPLPESTGQPRIQALLSAQRKLRDWP